MKCIPLKMFLWLLSHNLVVQVYVHPSHKERHLFLRKPQNDNQLSPLVRVPEKIAIQGESLSCANLITIRHSMCIYIYILGCVLILPKVKNSLNRV